MHQLDLKTYGDIRVRWSAKWSRCSSLEGEEVVFPVAVQVQAVNAVLPVKLFLEFVHLLRNFPSRHLLTFNTD
jgi:hypothetical protein